MFYTETYKATSRNIQVKLAVIGFLVFLALMFTFGTNLTLYFMFTLYSEMSDMREYVR